MSSKNDFAQKHILLAVVVSALGYFVDIYDLLLFGIVRMPSLQALGVPDSEMLDTGVMLLNMQMIGMLVGGVFWGILGDKRGRKSVLFGSILLYSLANIANAFVPNVPVYAVLRFIAGVGLAGELGAAITLVSEVMSKENRGVGTTIVASVGILGAVLASFIGDTFSWQTAYLVGGFMGLALLALRASLIESGMFMHMTEQSTVKKGHFMSLFTSAQKLRKYLACIFIGVPIWYVIGVLITFAPEFAKALNVDGLITGSKSIMWAYIGLSLGDLSSGLLSQFLKSRKKSVLFFLSLTADLVCFYISSNGLSTSSFYWLCLALGFGIGYWAIFVTIAAEHFGTNIRATVTTSVPNFVRGSVVPITLLFQTLNSYYDILTSLALVGILVFALGLVALYSLDETYGKDLNYFE